MGEDCLYLQLIKIDYIVSPFNIKARGTDDVVSTRSDEYIHPQSSFAMASYIIG